MSVAETLHAYGFRSQEGLEVLVHFGLETVALKGEYFKCHVKVGDRVKAGDLVAEADLEGLKAVSYTHLDVYKRQSPYTGLHRSCSRL